MRAEALMGEAQAVGESGESDRQRPVQVAVLDHGGPAEQVAGHPAGERVGGGIEAARRHHAAIQGVGGAVGQPDQHAAAAAKAAHPGLEHAQRQRGGDRGIDRVAASTQRLGPDRRRPAMLGRHDAAPGADHALAHLPAAWAHRLLPRLATHGGITLHGPAVATNWKR